MDDRQIERLAQQLKQPLTDKVTSLRSANQGNDIAVGRSGPAAFFNDVALSENNPAIIRDRLVMNVRRRRKRPFIQTGGEVIAIYIVDENV